MFRLKHKVLLLLVLITLFFIQGGLFTSVVKAEPIPAGCPGSQLQGPPAPGVCESIPHGCPGTTQIGPKAPNTTCPYDAPSSANEAEETNPNPNGTAGADCKDPDLNQSNCGIIGYLVDFINILAGLVGITAVVMLTVWGIQYTTSRDNPQAVASARGHIVQTVLALVFFLITYAFLQWLVPGGVL